MSDCSWKDLLQSVPLADVSSVSMHCSDSGMLYDLYAFSDLHNAPCRILDSKLAALVCFENIDASGNDVWAETAGWAFHAYDASAYGEKFKISIYGLHDIATRRLSITNRFSALFLQLTKFDTIAGIGTDANEHGLIAKWYHCQLFRRKARNRVVSKSFARQSHRT